MNPSSIGGRWAEDDLCVAGPVVLRFHVDASRFRGMLAEEVVDLHGTPGHRHVAQDDG